MPKYCYVFQIS